MPEAGGSAARNKILIDPHAPKFLVSIPGAPSRLFWAGVHSFFINHFDVRHSAGKEDNMTETQRKALDLLDTLCVEQRITVEEHAILTTGIRAIPLFGEPAESYDVFLVDGSFIDADDTCVDCIKFDQVDHLDLGALLRLSMRQDFDMVIRLDKRA